MTEAALAVELLGLAVQPRAERVVPKVLRVALARGAPEAALAVEHYGLALQILPKHADPLAEELWRSADGTVAPMLVPPLLELLLTGLNARHHRSAPRSCICIRIAVICKPSLSLHLSLHLSMMT